MDATISHNPFAPEPSYVLYTYESLNGELVCHAYGPTDQASAQAAGEQLKAQSADESMAGLGFMVLMLEAVPAAPSPEQPALAQGLAFSDGSALPAGVSFVSSAESGPESIVPSGEPQAEAPADPAAEAAPATPAEAPSPEGEGSVAPAVPVGTEPQNVAVVERSDTEMTLAGPLPEVPGTVETMEGQPGEAVNAETGEVTQPGEPLPPIPADASPADATPTEGTVQ